MYTGNSCLLILHSLNTYTCSYILYSHKPPGKRFWGKCLTWAHSKVQWFLNTVQYYVIWFIIHVHIHLCTAFCKYMYILYLHKLHGKTNWEHCLCLDWGYYWDLHVVNSFEQHSQCTQLGMYVFKIHAIPTTSDQV